MRKLLFVLCSVLVISAFAGETKESKEKDRMEPVNAPAVKFPFRNNKFSLSSEEKQEVRKVAEAIYSNPELSMKEHFACRTQVEFLTKHGFTVTTPCAGLETAYYAEFTSGEPVHTFAFCAEYDALKDIGHACGHNLICGSALAAAIATKNYLMENQIPGRIVVLGCPGEEAGCGKGVMADAGILKDIHALIMAHPNPGTSFSYFGYSNLTNVTVKFSCENHRGRIYHDSNVFDVNPVDAQVLLYQAVALKRTHLKRDVRLSGSIRDGGSNGNNIPQNTESHYALRTPEPTRQQELIDRFRAMAEGIALATDTKLEFDAKSTYRSTKPCAPLSNAFLDAAKQRGGEVPSDRTFYYNTSLTDFGNFSQLRPGVHMHFPIFTKMYPHTAEFQKAAGTNEAYESMFTASDCMTEVAVKYFSDASFRSEVQEAFQPQSRENK